MILLILLNFVCVSENKEKLYLYLTVSVAIGLVLVLLLLVGRLLVQRHRARREAKFRATTVAEHTLPNGFADEISEIDADIDLTAPAGAVRASTPLAGGGSVIGTLRREPTSPSSDAGTAAPPRSLTRPGNSQYYYG